MVSTKTIDRGLALVTLVIGEDYKREFYKYSWHSFIDYCDKYEIDLKMLIESLDKSKRAECRSPAWQKLLILSQEWLASYKQIVWVDSDIVIHPEAPNIFANVSVNEFGCLTSMRFRH